MYSAPLESKLKQTLQMKDSPKLSSLDCFCIAILVMKATGWLSITWPQALALPVFLFLAGVAQGIVEVINDKGSK